MASDRFYAHPFHASSIYFLWYKQNCGRFIKRHKSIWVHMSSGVYLNNFLIIFHGIEMIREKKSPLFRWFSWMKATNTAHTQSVNLWITIKLTFINQHDSTYMIKLSASGMERVMCDKIKIYGDTFIHSTVNFKYSKFMSIFFWFGQFHSIYKQFFMIPFVTNLFIFYICTWNVLCKKMYSSYSVLHLVPFKLECMSFIIECRCKHLCTIDWNIFL